jgi:hypothetical protein
MRLGPRPVHWDMRAHFANARSGRQAVTTWTIGGGTRKPSVGAHRAADALRLAMRRATHGEPDASH